MKWLAVGAVFCVAVDTAKVEGDLDEFNPPQTGTTLIHIQLGTLGLRKYTEGVHKLDGFPHCVDAAAIEGRTVRRMSFLKSSEEERVFCGLSPIWCYPEKWSGRNRITHPD